MLIDLSIRPPMVVPHEAEGHLILRTMETRQVSGVVGRGLEPLRSNVRYPMKGATSLLETEVRPLWLYGLESSVLPDPFEVATGYVDLVTGKLGQWRLQVTLQYRKNKTWLVQVLSPEIGPLVAVSTKEDLLPSSAVTIPCRFPLQRLMGDKLQGPHNAWSKLTEDTD